MELWLEWLQLLAMLGMILNCVFHLLGGDKFVAQGNFAPWVAATPDMIPCCSGVWLVSSLGRQKTCPRAAAYQETPGAISHHSGPFTQSGAELHQQRLQLLA